MNTASWKSIPFLVSIGLLLAIVLVGILAPVIAPHDPLRGSLRERNVPPAWMEGGSSAHLLGTDFLGRDVLSRLIYGARTSLLVTMAPMLAAAIIGSALGFIAGNLGRSNSLLDIRLLDFPLVLLALFPVLLAQFAVSPALAALFVLGPGILSVVAMTVVLPVLVVAHQVWRETLRTKAEGENSATSLDDRRMIPGALQPVAILVLLLMVYSLLLEAMLSFYGMGVPPPIPSWGSMMAEGRDRLVGAWWIFAFPALAILAIIFPLTVLAIHLRGIRPSGSKRSGMAGQWAVGLTALLAALLAMGVLLGGAASSGQIPALAWLIAAALVWQGYRHYRLPGSLTLLLGFALLLVSGLVGIFRWVLFLMAATVSDALAGVHHFLFSPLFVMPGLAETPYQRIVAWHLTPAVGPLVLAGAVLLAAGLWRIRVEALRRPAGGD